MKNKDKAKIDMLLDMLFEERLTRRKAEQQAEDMLEQNKRFVDENMRLIGEVDRLKRKYAELAEKIHSVKPAKAN